MDLVEIYVTLTNLFHIDSFSIWIYVEFNGGMINIFLTFYKFPPLCHTCIFNCYKTSSAGLINEDM